jgi:hypothetical protein
MKFLMSILVLLLVCFVGCKNKEITGNDFEFSTVYFCDAENLTKDGKKFVSKGVEFNGGQAISSEEAYEGRHSCLLDANNFYGLSLGLNDLKPGEVFSVSVCRKSHNNVGALVLSSLDGSLYKSVSYGDQLADGWEMISFNLQLPMDIDSLGGLKIYTYNSGKKGEESFFDNLKIIRSSKSLEKPHQENLNEISILLSDLDYTTINSYRDIALSQGLISNELKKEFDGFLKYKGETIRISIRLKGDWTDHIIGEKWSFRIKVKGGQTLMGLKSFSIQSPEVRDFLHEWVIHEIGKKEGLLTTQLDYVPVSINGMYFGIYNVEEHFEKQLIESKGRREGPILKFEEDGLWEYRANKNDSKSQRPIYHASNILPFNKKKTLKSNQLKNQFLIAQNLMLKYKSGAANVASYMDVERLAKMYALMDVCNAKHGIVWWHNQRFYYNPILSKLEPIIFDCSAGVSANNGNAVEIMGNKEIGVHSIDLPEEYLIKNTFNDSIFLKYYISSLKKFSNENYLNTIFNDLDFDIDSLVNVLAEDYPYYSYDKNFIKNNAKKIRETLPDYEKKSSKITYQLQESSTNECDSEAFLFKNISLNVYLQGKEKNGGVLLSLMNYHCSPLTIVGYSTQQFPDSTIELSNPKVLVNFPKIREPFNLKLKTIPKKIFFKVEGDTNNVVHNVKIFSWPRPQLELRQDEFLKAKLDKESTVYELKSGIVTFKKGKHFIQENIIIKTGLKVVFEAGTELVFNDKTFFMSYSPVIMEGSKESPIKISSTDGSGNGFTILQAIGQSRLNYVSFDGLSTFNYEGWSLTGAVTFYESDVRITNCSFNNNKCEDGLNIIQSKFVFEKSIISNAFSDGLDADFCEGRVSKSLFFNIGNDCLDFSGGRIDIAYCYLNNAGDKGISCGEKSTVVIDQVFINHAKIGVSSKDKSTVKISEVDLVNCLTGFSVFQKKPAYGPALIIVEKYSMEQALTPYDVGEGSELFLGLKKERNTISEKEFKVNADLL